MEKRINQAVIFTKPVHHLSLSLTPEELDEKARSYFDKKGFSFVVNTLVSGSDLSRRNAIKAHYKMYSEASCADSAAALAVTDEGRARFESAFSKSWEDEVAAGKIMGNPTLLKEKGITANELFLLWNDCFANRQTQKIQDGLLIAYLADLDCYCINAFYPAMEENFYHPDTRISYYVVEFDPEQVSWEDFRKNVLGATDASKAHPDSFRGQLYTKYKVEFPGRDNFVHGSAGPVEGFIERTIHEEGFNGSGNPVAQYLEGRNVSIGDFKAWKDDLGISELGDLFDRTEEKNTDDALAVLDTVHF